MILADCEIAVEDAGKAAPDETIAIAVAIRAHGDRIFFIVWEFVRRDRRVAKKRGGDAIFLAAAA